MATLLEPNRLTCFVTGTLVQGTGRPGVPMYRSLRAFISDARHNWLLAAPAGLYAINNYLKFTMQLYFRCDPQERHGRQAAWVCFRG
jgi:hypothetical protein